MRYSLVNHTMFPKWYFWMNLNLYTFSFEKAMNFRFLPALSFHKPKQYVFFLCRKVWYKCWYPVSCYFFSSYFDVWIRIGLYQSLPGMRVWDDVQVGSEDPTPNKTPVWHLWCPGGAVCWRSGDRNGRSLETELVSWHDNSGTIYYQTVCDEKLVDLHADY